MITYKSGDLLNAPEHYIVHGCNCQGKMNSGVAKAIRERWPIVYEDYIEHDRIKGLRPGDITITHLDDYKWVVNAMTQDYYGYDGKRYVSYDAVRDCFRNLHKIIGDGESVALPKIGSGLGGGDWAVIEKIIEEEMPNNEVAVYVL